MPTMPSEYELFRLYSKEVKKFLKEKIYLSRYPLNENVQVEYATPPRAFAKFLVPVLNGGNLNPTVTFYLENMEYAENENLLGFVKEWKLNGTKYEHVYAPLVYKLTYKAVIMVANPSDADAIQFQLLAAARKNKKYWTKLESQWLEMVTLNPVDDSSVEPGEEDKIYKRSVNIVIPRAYLPMEYLEYGIIEQINVKLETLESLDEAATEIEGVLVEDHNNIVMGGRVIGTARSSGVINKVSNQIGVSFGVSTVEGSLL